VDASYHAIHQVLSNPVYAGAYTYGRTRQETTLDRSGAAKKRTLDTTAGVGSRRSHLAVRAACRQARYHRLPQSRSKRATAYEIIQRNPKTFTFLGMSKRSRQNLVGSEGSRGDTTR
jgi:Recombinase